MSVKEERGLTQCSVDIHLEKSFVIALPKPSEERLNDFRARYDLAKLAVDDDNDLIGREGNLPEAGGRVQQIGLVYSSDRAAAICLGTTTEAAITAIEDLMRSVYGARMEDFRRAVNYLSYDTATKVTFSGPLHPLFSRQLQSIFARWEDVDSGAVVTPMRSGEWPPTRTAMVHTTGDYWEKYFGEGAPKRGFVMPSNIRFQVKIPTRFYKMLNYEVLIVVESTEDFLEHRYFVKSDFPYRAHIEVLNEIDALLTEPRT